MKKLFVVLFVFAIVGGYVFGSNSAELEINGTVAEIVLIDFVDGDESTTIVPDVSPVLVDPETGAVNATVSLGVYTWERANAGYTITIDQVTLNHTTADRSFTYDVDYNSSGSATAGSWNPVSLINGSYSVANEVPLEGTYTGTLIATITASN